MSVWLYMGDQAEKIDPFQLEAHRQAGWSLEPNQDPEKVTVTTVEPALVDQATDEPMPQDTQEEPQAGEGNQPTESETLSNEQIREMAQSAGIENWQTAQIKTLKTALGI